MWHVLLLLLYVLQPHINEEDYHFRPKDVSHNVIRQSSECETEWKQITRDQWTFFWIHKRLKDSPRKMYVRLHHFLIFLLKIQKQRVIFYLKPSLRDEDAPPSHLPLSWSNSTILSPRKGLPLTMFKRGPSSVTPHYVQPVPLQLKGPLRASSTSNRKKESHKPHLHLIWLSFMVDTWPSELLLVDRLDKLSAWHTNLRVTFFFQWNTRIPSVSAKHEWSLSASTFWK